VFCLVLLFINSLEFGDCLGIVISTNRFCLMQLCLGPESSFDLKVDLSIYDEMSTILENIMMNCACAVFEQTSHRSSSICFLAVP